MDDIVLDSDQEHGGAAAAGTAADADAADGDAPPHILIVSCGSRGDVQPFVALALALVRVGFSVTVATHAPFREFVDKHTQGDAQISFFEMTGDPAEILKREEMQEAIMTDDKLKSVQMMRAMMDEHKKMMLPNMHRVWEAAQQRRPVAIVCGITNQVESISVAQKLNVPAIVAATVPIAPTSAYTPVGMGEAPRWLNPVLHWTANKMMKLGLGDALKQFRAEALHLPPFEGDVFGSAPVLGMYSRYVLPPPPDYPAFVHTTGYWVLPAGDAYEPDAELAQFLAAGDDKPVYMGFGSMPVRDVRSVAADFAEALQRCGRRGIFCAGWNDFEKAAAVQAPHLLVIRGAPHDWLLPRCAMAIHHGGAGTTCASLRAGIPTVIFHFLVDQPFWAARVRALRAGPAGMVHVNRLNAEKLAELIGAAMAEEIVESAAELGAKIRDEDGVAEAVRLIVRYIVELGCEDVPRCEWRKDEEVSECEACAKAFTVILRRHHCRSCGGIFCGDCVLQKQLPNFSESVLVCPPCTEKRGLKQKRVRSAESAE